MRNREPLHEGGSRLVSMPRERHHELVTHGHPKRRSLGVSEAYEVVPGEIERESEASKDFDEALEVV